MLNKLDSIRKKAKTLFAINILAMLSMIVFLCALLAPLVAILALFVIFLLLFIILEIVSIVLSVQIYIEISDIKQNFYKCPCDELETMKIFAILSIIFSVIGGSVLVMIFSLFIFKNANILLNKPDMNNNFVNQNFSNEQVDNNNLNKNKYESEFNDNNNQQNKFEMIEKAFELKEKGIISEDEFQKIKDKFI